jgi:hypothetical protein
VFLGDRELRDLCAAAVARLGNLVQRKPGGGVRFFVACSNAYATCSSFGSLQAGPVKPTP